LVRSSKQKLRGAPWIFIVLTAVIGAALLYVSKAATNSVSLEPEAGTLSGTCLTGADEQASTGQYVTFRDCTPPPTTFNNPVSSFSGWGAPNATKGPDGKYYSIGSQPLQKVKVSNTLHTGWQELSVPTFTNAQYAGGIAFPQWAQPSTTDQPRWMGTELHFINNTWILASSFRKFVASRPAAQQYAHTIAIATSSAADGPTGPYTWVSEQVNVYHADENHVDPSFFQDAGKLWLLYNVSYISHSNDKAIRAVELDVATYRPKPATDSVLLLTTEDNKPWEDDCSGDRIEAPGMFKHSGTYYLYYAAGSDDMALDNVCPYKMGMARSSTFPSSSLFEKAPNPLLVGQTGDNCASPCWRGPGHGAVIKDQSSTFYFFYQAKQTVNSSKTPFLQQMLYNASTRWFYFETGQIQHSGINVPSY
jgi:beta-xylosidase